MMTKQLLIKNKVMLIMALFLTIFNSYSQDDIGVITINNPTASDCDMGTYTISVDIQNYDNSTLFGTFPVRYQLDNDPVESSTNFNTVGFSGGGTKTHTFTFAPLDLSGNYGTHTLRVYTDLGSDTDRSNDTMSFTFTNYEPTVAGTIASDDTVCAGSNNDTIFLTGNIGSVVQWEFNTGNGWTPIVSTDSFQVYNNLTVSTRYRALVQNGNCSQQYTNIVSITVTPQSDAGTLSSDNFLCLGQPGDTLELMNYVGTIQKWQMNSGSGWMDIANTTDTLTYGSLTQTTSYRAIVDTGVCGPDTSNVVTVTVVTGTVGGNLMSPATVCAGQNYDTLTLMNSVGNINQWEFSEDNGVSWQPLINNDTFQLYSNLMNTRLYRVQVESSGCGIKYSDTIQITVLPAAMAGTLMESTTICSGTPGDTLELINYVGTIQKWQINSGSGWMDVANTTDTLIYGTLTQTTSYRVIVDTGVCGADTSNIATITVVSGTVGGNLMSIDTVCYGSNYDTLFLTNSVGNVNQWEFSEDNGASWQPLINNDTFQAYSNLINTRLYRVQVQATGCNIEYSDTVQILVAPTPIGGDVMEDKSICGGSNTDTLYLENYTGMIVKWQYDNGAGWTDIANTSDTLFVSNITTTTSYRAIVGNGGYCPNDTSTPATLTVIAVTFGGYIMSSDSVCTGMNFDTLTLVGHIGDIRWWERSTDFGASWTPLANVDTFQLYSNLTQTTWYRVLVEGTSCPNDYSDTAIITVYTPNVTITASDSIEFCEGDSVILTATLGYDSYLWNTGEDTSSIIAYTSGKRKVTITDNNGCMNSDSVDIVVNTLPIADAGSDATISLGASYVLQGAGGDEYFWTPVNDLDDPYLQNPTATPSLTTEYILLVTDINGCQDLDSMMLTVEKDFNFGPKNTITPNGDGFNDTWKVDNLMAYSECEVIIMNRFGEVIYQKKGYDNSWAGTSNGEKVADGTYYYVISCSDEIIKKGHITVLSK